MVFIPLKLYFISVLCKFNNTIFTITDSQGNTLFWITPAKLGIIGASKSRSSSVKTTTLEVAKKLIELNNGNKPNVIVYMNGFGPGRQIAARTLNHSGLIIRSLVDISSNPHGGCRPPKQRRV